MLQPKRVKYRRPQDGRGNKGNAHRGTQLAFGSFGIKTLEAKWIDSRQKGCQIGWRQLCIYQNPDGSVRGFAETVRGIGGTGEDTDVFLREWQIGRYYCQYSFVQF